jgi:hypothetical protein
MSIITNNNVINIINTLDALPNVVQVRAHYVLKNTIKETYGANAVIFLSYVTHTHENAVDDYNTFLTLATEDVYNNQSYADQIVGNVKFRIKMAYSNTLPEASFTNSVSATLEKDELGNSYVKFNTINMSNRSD